MAEVAKGYSWSMGESRWGAAVRPMRSYRKVWERWGNEKSFLDHRCGKKLRRVKPRSVGGWNMPPRLEGLYAAERVAKP